MLTETYLAAHSGALHQEEIDPADLPSPFGYCLDPHPVYFNGDGEPVVMLRPGGDTIVMHIVPEPGNPYAQRFGVNATQGWGDPGSVLRFVEEQHAVGVEVVVHPSPIRVRVVGSGRGRSRFLCGNAVSLYVITELGRLPYRVAWGGSQLFGMAAVYGVTLGGSVPGFHLLPVGYLSDPAQPEPPLDSPPEERIERWLGTLQFAIGDPIAELPGLFSAMVSIEGRGDEGEREGGGV